MHHSYEGLDRTGGFTRVRLLAPLAYRDYRLLCGAMSISLLGDGLFLVALAWQVYALSNAPTALATVGIAMTVPTIVCLLIGGAVSDRVDRRRVMIAADAVRAVVMWTLSVLALVGALALWHLWILTAVYGVATAFFSPASDAVVPEVLPAGLLANANSLDQLIRPLALRLAGPALGGVVVAWAGTGGAFLADAASFLLSVAAVGAMAPARPAPARTVTRVAHEIREGLRYVRRHAWLWATFASAAVAYLLFMGPTEVLLPFIVKNEFHGGATGLGLVFAAGGLGSLLCALLLGQHGLPRRPVTFMYITWTVATVAVAGYGLSTAVWGLMVTSVAFNVLETAGTIAWATVKQRHVPGQLLGRVSSLDWLISIGLLPLSFALTGPAAGFFGWRATLVGAGLLGGAVTLLALYIPGVRAPEREDPAGDLPVPPPALAEPDFAL